VIAIAVSLVNYQLHLKVGIRTFFFLAVSLGCFQSQAQTALKDYQYLSISSDNDYYYWFGYSNDRYYTAGNSITYGFAAVSKRKLVNLILPTFYHSSPSVFSFRIFQQLNTPTYLMTTDVDSADYPFAGALYSTIARNTLSPSGNARWKTELHIGIIGPAALGSEAQILFHKLTESAPPIGWKNQLPNQLILNYAVEYEGKLYSFAKNCHLTGDIQGAFGTFNTYVQTGFSINLFNRSNLVMSDFTLWQTPKRWTLLLSVAPAVRLVFWNSMLQGTPIDRNKDYYHVSAAALTRLLPMFALKVTVARGRHTIHGQQTFLGREFRSVDPQVYGTIAYTLRIGSGS